MLKIKKIKTLILFLLLGNLFLINSVQTKASMAMPRYAINEETKECTEFFMGDECMYCNPPSGWDIIEKFECPEGYKEIQENSVCTRSKTSFCCTVNHSGANGDCEDVIVNNVEQKCAFVDDIDNCSDLPENWNGAENVGFWGKACPSLEYEWVEDLKCKKNETAKPIQIQNMELGDRLKGKIILKVEENGEAYYINPNNNFMYFLDRPDDAFSVMREQGVGITNDDIEKIEIGLSSLTGSDLDGDGLSDIFEEAINTNKNNPDTDGDGYNDKQELEGNYDPNKAGGVKLEIDNVFSEKQKGKILLQVENNGEAWYINPEDGKRYFLGRPADAFAVMRNLGLGISNEDFGRLTLSDNF